MKRKKKPKQIKFTFFSRKEKARIRVLSFLYIAFLNCSIVCGTKAALTHVNRNTKWTIWESKKALRNRIKKIILD